MLLTAPRHRMCVCDKTTTFGTAFV